MPVYTVLHRSYISTGSRRKVAEELTSLHTNVTGAEPHAVKVMFFELDTHSIFIGGERPSEYVRIVAQIRQGRTDAQKADLLDGMHKILKAVVLKGEIQVQIQEIDDTKTTMATPAEPILASALWTANQTTHQDAPEEVERSPRTGCQSIDKTFDGAFQYGTVCCISAEANSGGRELCEAYVASHLLSTQDAMATVIDTALSFDVRKFHRMVLSRLEGQSDAEQLAMATLERLKIMKVFDVEGLMESITEVRSTIEGLGSENDMHSEGLKTPRSTIGDSEDEDEMLDSPSPPPPMRAAVMQGNINKASSSPQLLLIDSISHIIAPVMRNRYVEGQALLISFIRSLTHLTTTNRLLTILSNDAIPKANVKDESPSVFTSCTVRPALGRSFEHMLDTHLLVHRTHNKMASNQPDQNAAQAGLPAVEKRATIVEVLQDTHGGAFGRWTAFTIDDSGRLRDYS